MTATGISPRARDFFHDHRGLGQAQPRSTKLFWNECCHPTRLRQRVDKGFGIRALVIDVLPVGRIKLQAQRTNRVADLGVVVGVDIDGLHNEKILT